MNGNVAAAQGQHYNVLESALSRLSNDPTCITLDSPNVRFFPEKIIICQYWNQGQPITTYASSFYPL
ncbi:MAG: hypothetical protein HRF40_03660 [Nitrososphaera sp.]